MRVSAHQYAAIVWLISAPFGFGPVVASATHPEASRIVMYGIIVMAAAMLTTPVLLRWGAFRRWFCWTDALSQRQRQAAERKDIRGFYEAATADGYRERVTPYLWRLTWAGAIGVLIGAGIPDLGGRNIELLAASSFLPLYPLGVVLSVMVTMPWKRSAEEK